MSKGKRRNPRREVARRFRRLFQDPRLDLEAQVARERPKALLFGIAVALGVYGAVFLLAYLAWALGKLGPAELARVSWIAMVPGIMVGAGAWLINRSRREYPIRQALRAHLEQLEGRDGLLWRFAALLPNGADAAAKRACQMSREGRLDEVDLEDYLAGVRLIARRLEEDPPDEALAAEVLACLEEREAAA